MAKKKAKAGKVTKAAMTGQGALQEIYGEAGVKAGEELQNMIQPGSYGRLSTNVPGQQEVLNRMKAGLGGYTSPEYQAQREQQMRGVQSNYATAASQLAKAQARGKVYGAAGAAQQSNLIRSSQNQKDQLEQDLYVKNIDEQRSRLSEYGAANENANLYNLDIEKNNLANQQAEISDRVGAYTGGLGAGALAKQLAEMRKIQKQGIKAANR